MLVRNIPREKKHISIEIWTRSSKVFLDTPDQYFYSKSSVHSAAYSLHVLLRCESTKREKVKIETKTHYTHAGLVLPKKATFQD